METRINIAKILKDKSRGTKLYSIVHGECTFEAMTDEIFKINFCNSKFGLAQSGECTLIKFGNMYDNGECIIFPSKNMRDWGKFAWKKGDLLINSCGFQCIFKEWSSDDYTKFNGCYSNSRDGYEDVSNAETAKFVKLDNNTAYGYVREIERKLGGILNLQTLEIEKTNQEFKDGDVLFVKCNDSAFIEIFKYSKNNGDLYDRASLDTTNQILDISGRYRIGKDEITEIRLATEAEKKQLFDALAKEGKRWDAEKKMIVYLKPKVDLKPFDKVVVRCSEADRWSIDFFSYKVHNGYICTGDAWFGYCLPYNDETAHLLGTTDEWEGGEG